MGRVEASKTPPYTLQAVDYVDALWVISEVKDRAGNRVVYHYKTLAFPDQPDQYSLEYMPESIEYTLRPGEQDGKREVKFLYEDRPRSVRGACGGPCRLSGGCCK